MSNELVLSSDLNVITAEINSYKQVAGQAIFEIGRRLKWVKENDLVHGEWSPFLNSIQMSKSQADRFIKVFKEHELDKLPHVGNIGFRALYEIATLPEEERAKSHTIPSSGEQKTVDEMTVKELREVKKALKQAEEDKERLGQLLNEERNKPPKIETRVETKTVDNTDYETINKLNKQLQSVEKQKNLLEQKVKLEEQDAAEYRKLKDEIQRLHSEKDDLHRQIESATSLSALYAEIEHLLQGKLAPVKYSKALTERRDSKVAMDNLLAIIQMVEEWTFEMKKYLPNNNTNYIDVEVID